MPEDWSRVSFKAKAKAKKEWARLEELAVAARADRARIASGEIVPVAVLDPSDELEGIVMDDEELAEATRAEAAEATRADEGASPAMPLMPQGTSQSHRELLSDPTSGLFSMVATPIKPSAWERFQALARLFNWSGTSSGR